MVVVRWQVAGEVGGEVFVRGKWPAKVVGSKWDVSSSVWSRVRAVSG